ncbi:MAG: sigma-70 family RNA polymerase sigma factor [Candidatus Stahlbacteria bacterium]|nr:sigma-70 family RNA polymerase sigma factor [Candidatus Stahlbacteria bacterium]
MALLSDKVLVKRAKSGDFHSFDELVSRYETKVYNLAYRMLGSQDDAKDILQETFISAFKALNNFREKASFSTWIYRIATNACLMKFRTKEPRVISIDKEPLVAETIDWSESLSDTLDREELKKVLDKAISSLPKTHRVVFVLRDIEGLSSSEASKVLNISIAAVKSRLHRARLYLREKLSKYLRGEE